MKPLHITLIFFAMPIAACQDKNESIRPTNADRAPKEITRHNGMVMVAGGSTLGKRLVVEPVKEKSVEQAVEAPASLEAAPDNVVKINMPIGGRILRLHHQLGDFVKEGEPLVTVDSPELAAASSEAEKANASLSQAQAELKRQVGLQSADISARRDLEAAELAVSVAESDLRASKNRLSQFGAGHGNSSDRKYTIRSPIQGNIVELSGFRGGYWNDTSASFMTIADLSTVWVVASIPEKDISKVTVGQQASIAIDAYPGRAFLGKVRYISEMLDPETRSTKVRISLSNDQAKLKPGMWARVTLTGGQHRVLTIPTSAVFQSGLNTRVFVEAKPFHYESRVVTVGAESTKEIEILSGLSENERIVVKNGVLLND